MMKVALFVPYGNFRPEAGLIYLVANYLSKNGAEVTQLRCNGAFSKCARDEKENWSRSNSACLKCTGEQLRMSKWAGVRSVELSTFLHSDDVSQTFKWIHSLNAENLLRAEFRGMNVFALCKETFKARFGSEVPNLNDPAQDQFLRDLSVSAVHACAANQRFISWHQPQLILSSGGGDYMTQSLMTVIAQSEIDYGHFDFDKIQAATLVGAKGKGGTYLTKLVIEGVESLRSDPRSWAPEITSVVHEILSFLGYGPDKALNDLAPLTNP